MIYSGLAAVHTSKKRFLTLYFYKIWWAVRDSNPRPSACKADALNQLR